MNTYVITYTTFNSNNQPSTCKIFSKGNTHVEAKFNTISHLINQPNSPCKITIDDIKRVD